MIFASDNWSGAAPEISKALEQHSAGMASAYGTSDLDNKIENRFNEIFETEVSVFFVGTGTAANSLALAAAAQPGGVAFCHNEAHLVEDECGAPEFFTGGGRLVRVPGEAGKIDPVLLAEAVARYPKTFNHQGQATLVSLTQASETGSVYSCDEISCISKVARDNNLFLHMDGARFANALVGINATPAGMTWKNGVDVVSFGGTKNGCWCAEALVVFNKELARKIPFLRKRAGHLFSKNRFVAAQFEAYFADELWLQLARHSNAMAEKLREGIRKSNRVRLAWESSSNLVFFIADRKFGEELADKGARFYPTFTPSGYGEPMTDEESIFRLVASFSSTSEDVDAFLGLLR